MKVLHIPNYYYPNIGGIEQTARDLVSVFAEENIEQRVICFNTTVSRDGYTCTGKNDQRDIVDGVEVVRCGVFAKLFSQSLSLSYRKLLKKELKDFTPDMVILHYPNPFVGFLLMPLLKPNTRLVIYWHSDIIKQKIVGKLFEGLSKRLLHRAEFVIATSPNYIEGSKMLQSVRGKCKVIPSCINTDRLKVTEAVNKKAKVIKHQYPNDILCFSIGRHVEYKGYKYLIEAASLLEPNIKVLLGGDGPQTEELKRQASGCNNVVFLGRLSEEDLIAYYHACDIFLFPSITKNEAFGLVLAEAMYFGKPAITFTIPGSGVNYVSIADVTGLECPNKDIEALGSAMNMLVRDDCLRTKMGSNAQGRVNDLFVFEKYKELVKIVFGI